MIRALILAVMFALSTSLSCGAQSPDATPPAQSETSKPAAPSTSAAGSQKASAKATTAQDSSQQKKKSKKVWTNDDVSKINGNVSVIGGAQEGSSSSTSSSSENSSKDPSAQSSREKQLAGYRDKLRGLRAQFEEMDKKISELRNFKGDNSSASGGINMNQGYSMTPVADQIKQLEAKKAQLQDQIDSVESEARKNGFDPGDLR